ncbi:hypothetical protein, partial [Sinorhizobium sp. BJ1]|uniref:hypothetical protein n=1 Tax=Sinorhizobium sp. BJ1 TaxID=2035455 RepID=UPI001AECCB86
GQFWRARFYFLSVAGLALGIASRGSPLLRWHQQGHARHMCKEFTCPTANNTSRVSCPLLFFAAIAREYRAK